MTLVKNIQELYTVEIELLTAHYSTTVKIQRNLEGKSTPFPVLPYNF